MCVWSKSTVYVIIFSSNNFFNNIEKMSVDQIVLFIGIDFRYVAQTIVEFRYE